LAKIQVNNLITREKSESLRLRFRALRNVNRIIVRERDRGRLLQGICDNFIQNRAYYSAWIALIDASGKVRDTAGARLNNEFLAMFERNTRGDFTACVHKALAQPELVTIQNTSLSCQDCPIVPSDNNKAVMVIRLEHGDRVFGVLSVSIPRDYYFDEEEQSLYREIAEDIAFALYHMELEEDRREALEDKLRLAAIVESSDDAILGKTLDGVIQSWNAGAELTYGYSAEEIIGKSILILIPPEKSNELPQILEKIRHGDKIDRFETLRRRKDGSIIPISLTISPIKDSSGKTIGASTVARDITARKKSEEALEKTLHKLDERVNELNCLYAISRLRETRELSLEEILRGTIDLLSPAWRYAENVCARIILDGKEFKTDNFKETVWKQASGITVNGVPSGSLEVYYLEERPEQDEGPFLKEERHLIDAVAERLGRIVEARRARESLQLSEKRFRDLVEHSLTGITIIQDARVVYKNSEQERILGPHHQTFESTGFEGIHPDDVEKVKQMYERIDSGEVPASNIDFRFFPLNESETRPERKWIHCRASRIEYQGKPAKFINMIDMTRAKELEHLVGIQDKMTSLGRVAAGIAHEIRNPLSGINIYLNTLEKIYDRQESKEKVQQIISQLQSASNKIESVIRRVMDFSKPGEPHFVSTDINQPVNEAIELSSVTLKKSGITIEKDLAKNLPLCHCDPRLIDQVMLNLITNAAEAMKNMDEGKLIHVSTRYEKDHLLIKVADSGPGVPPELREKIFDPFYTTKSDSSGIGLSINERIIADHGGLLEVSPSRFNGAEFTIQMPVRAGK